MSVFVPILGVRFLATFLATFLAPGFEAFLDTLLAADFAFEAFLAAGFAFGFDAFLTAGFAFATFFAADFAFGVFFATAFAADFALVLDFVFFATLVLVVVFVADIETPSGLCSLDVRRCGFETSVQAVEDKHHIPRKQTVFPWYLTKGL